jgi:hypothetical protein
MPTDFLALLSHDHKELEAALAAMEKAARGTREDLERVRMMFDVHVMAETRVLDDLVAATSSADVFQIATMIRRAHDLQRVMFDELTLEPPGTHDWYARTSDLRAIVLDHRFFAHRRTADLRYHLSDLGLDLLAGQYLRSRQLALAEISSRGTARSRSLFSARTITT